uniref:28S ribosomal protein S34, mitochondrial n=1 Tax=Parascaris univalens TaxID=6257 RepID=A0A914ZUR6_PARUN
MKVAMSAIKYIGNYDVTAEGKFLWELLCQIRGLGVGRLVTKNEWARKWPHQPSYLRIIKARPSMDRWLYGGQVWAEWTFRGRNLGIYKFNSDLNRSDWRLIHKHEEEEFMKCNEPMGNIETPNSFPLPPLQILLAKKYARKNKLNFSKSQERAPLEVCVDPEFEMLRPFIVKVDPLKKGKSIYDEANPEVWLGLYGKELPTKVEAWNVGPAELRQRFPSTTITRSSKDIVGAVV